MIYRKAERKDDIIMVLGPGCSDVSSSVAEAAKYWNLTVVLHYIYIFNNIRLLYNNSRNKYLSFHLVHLHQLYLIENALKPSTEHIHQLFSIIQHDWQYVKNMAGKKLPLYKTRLKFLRQRLII